MMSQRLEVQDDWRVKGRKRVDFAHENRELWVGIEEKYEDTRRRVIWRVWERKKDTITKKKEEFWVKDFNFNDNTQKSH